MFLLAFKRDGYDVFKAATVDQASARQEAKLDAPGLFTSRCAEAWNPSQEPPLKDWLTSNLSQEDTNRLVSLGNVVYPRMAEFAVSLILHSVR